MNRLFEAFVKFIYGKSRAWRAMMTALSALIVFSTTYALILPAITIDYNRAYEEPGLELDDAYFEDVYFGENPADASGLVYDDPNGISFDGNEPDVYFEGEDNGFVNDTYFEDEADNYFENADAGLFVDDENAFLTEDNEAGIYGDVLFDDEAGLLPDPEAADSMAVIVEDMIDVDSIVPEAEEPADIFVDDEDEAEYVEEDAENVEAEETAAEADDAEIVADDVENDADDVEVSEDEAVEASDEAAESEFTGEEDTEVTASVVEEEEEVYEFMAANAAEMAEAEDTEVSEADEAAEMIEAVASDAEEIESVESQIEEVVDAEEVVSEDEAESVSSDVEEVMDAEEAVPADEVESVSSEVEEVMDAAESVSSEVEEVMDAAESVSSEVEEVMDAADSTLSEVEDMIDSTDSTTSEVEDVVAFEEATWSDAESAAESVPSYANGVEDIEEVYPAVDFYRATPYVSVKVHADEGAFPAGTTMTVEDVEDEETITAITEAAEETEAKVRKLHAVNITFLNVDGQEIEPLIPISVEIRSEQIAENEKAMVVHVDDDGNATALSDVEVEAKRNSAVAEVTKEGTGEFAADEFGMIDSFAEEVPDTVEFEAGEFSVYAIVYTVDFHWEVDGKVYEFSIPGGGFVSLEHLVEALGIKPVTDDTEDSRNAEKAAADANNTEKWDVYENTLDINSIPVSEETKLFVSDVEKVEFSDPKLVWAGKVDAETAIGTLKEENGLEVQYSSELSEEQIKEINAQTVKADDWALISVLPFTSEESLKVTMKNGDEFTIQVTDGQLHTYVISDSGETYEIIVSYDDTAEIPADAELKVREIEKTEDEFTKNVEATNKELQAQDAPEVVNPKQFDISIVSGGVEVEPKEGSTVNVEIRLAPEVFSGKTEDEEVSEEGDNSENEETGEIWFNGSRIEENGEGVATYTVSHISDDGTVDIIENVESSVNEDEKVVLQFETESFSDYLMGNPDGPGGLPSTIYVGDEIYMWERADYWVTEIDNVVTETKHKPNGYNDGSNWKTVTAIRPGKFRIYNRYNERDYKEITVLPAREDTTLPGTIDTVDNASIGLKLNLFDYDLDDYLDDYFNNFNHSNNPVSYDFLNHGINNGHPLKFWGSGIGNNYGSANQYQEHGVTSIVQRNLVGGVGGYPQLTANSNPDRSTESLAYLFTPSNGTDKEAYTNVNHLFKREGDYYVYDSNSNYAYYDKNQGSGGNFVVYDRTYKQKSGSDSGSIQDKAIGFFPFHKWNEDYDLYVNWNKNLNHHFGMSMSVPFSLPKDPKVVKDSTGQPIIFEFSGDDDLWVFIDGKLAMDIGGIHQPTKGTINFMTGEVVVNGARQNGFDFSGLYDGEKHTLQVFYIERGGCDSNCMIKFNMTQYGDVEFDKVDADDNSLLAGAVFGLYKDDRCTIPLTEELKTGGRRAFIVETDANGHAKLEDVPLGDYYLKEIHAPDGYPIAIGDGTVRVRVYLDSNGNVKTSINGEETDAKILNRKPAKINLGLKKEWQNTNGQPITAPYGVTATFEIKRIRTYETYTEREVQGHGEEASHLTVGWIHNNVPHIYEEFDLIAGTQATVSWSLVNGYTGKIGCLINGVEYTKSSNTNNIYSQGLTMPAAGQTTVLYIIDESENGDAIKNINVAGSQFYGNSGGGFIHEFHTITEPDPDFTYTDTAVSNNQVTLPINESTWQYTFSNLPSLGTGMVTVEGKQQKVTYKYSYYLEEVSSTAPEGTTVIYKDLNGNVINSPIDAETGTSGTQTIINKVVEQDLALKKVGVNNTDPNLTQNPVGGAKFTIYHATGANKDQKGAVVQIAADQKLENLVSADVTGLFWSGKLLAGDYIIEEVEAPLGYVKVSGLIRMTVTKDGVNLSYIGTTGTPPYNQPKKEGNTWAITIINTAGASLPNTGGFGTKPFTIGGMMLVLMSLMLYCIGGRHRTLAEEFSIGAGGSAGRKGGDPRL